jgi:hypothetical protein
MAKPARTGKSAGKNWVSFDKSSAILRRPLHGYRHDATITASTGKDRLNHPSCQIRLKTARRRAMARADPTTLPDSIGGLPFFSVPPF